MSNPSKRFTIPENDEIVLQWWEMQNSPSTSLRVLIHAFVNNHSVDSDVLSSLSSFMSPVETKTRTRTVNKAKAKSSSKKVDTPIVSQDQPEPVKESLAKPEPQPAPAKPVERPAQVVSKVDEQKKKPVSNPTTGEKSGQELLDSMSKEEIKNMDGLTAMRAFFE